MIKREMIIVVSSIALILIIALCIHINNANIPDVRDKDAFLSDEYAGYNHGEDAKEFFDSYADTGEYKDLSFYYHDGEKLIQLFLKSKFKGWTVFMLDVCYEEDQFYQIADTVLDEVGETQLKNSVDNWCEYKIVKNDPLYQQNTAIIMFDEERYIIRYAFFCGYPSDERVSSDDMIIVAFGGEVL